MQCGVKTAEKPRLTRCPKCGYTWWSKGRTLYAVCPNCFYRFKRERGELVEA